MDEIRSTLFSAGLRRLLTEALQPGEHVLWQSQPDGVARVMMWRFLWWVGFPWLLLTAIAISRGWTGQATAPLLMVGIAMIAAPFVMLLFDMQTLCAITNRRALIVRTAWGERTVGATRFGDMDKTIRDSRHRPRRRPSEFRVGKVDPLSGYRLHRPLRVPLHPKPFRGTGYSGACTWSKALSEPAGKPHQAYSGHGTPSFMLWPQNFTLLAIKADQHPASHGWDKNMLKAFFTTAALLLVLAPPAALAQRAGDAALGAVAGAVVLGPVGAVAGAFVGYTAGPSISRSWGLEGSRSSRQRRQASRDVRGARAEAVGPVANSAGQTERGGRAASYPVPNPPRSKAPPVQTLE